MNPARRFEGFLQFPWVAAVAAALLLGGCTAPTSVTSTPPGASVTVNARPVGTTPAQVNIEGGNVVDVGFELAGYFPEHVMYKPDPSNPRVEARLEPRTQTRSFTVAVAPEGAALALDQRPVTAAAQGALTVEFERAEKSDPWPVRQLSVSKPDYQTEVVALTTDSDLKQRVELTLLRKEKLYAVSAVNTDGATLNAEVVLDGNVVGKTPLSVPVVFERRSKNLPWPRHSLVLRVPAKYKQVEQPLEFGELPRVAARMEPIIEVVTKRTYSSVVLTPTGAEMRVQQSSNVAMLDTRETTEVVSDLKPVTALVRQDLPEAALSRAECINSFCITPDGQNIVYSLTEHDEQGGLYSNLFIKRADDSAGGVARLTQGSRYWDSAPYIANDGSNYLVFSSNRGDRNKSDIFRVNLVDNRLSGGISRLTNDGRFNYRPSYGDSNRQLFYLSMEADFPRAEPQISSIRIDGSLPTQLSVTAQEICNTFAERVYFVKVDRDTGKKQIYSITADGKLETALLNQEDFRKANCFSPAVTADGSKVLFVSDRGTDEQGRANNDIYVVNADGSNLVRLTQNGSDDIAPVWSPTEERVLYFLSNRGGAYNVWRMKLTGGGK